MDRVKAAAPLKGFVTFDEDDAKDAETETLSGMEVPPHLLEEHAE